MKLCKIAYSNYRGIAARKEIDFGDSNIFVGRNDSGKSTILRGLDLFLNNSEALPDISNAFSDSPTCSIELAFEGAFPDITIDEAIPTTFEDELLLDESGQLRIKKEWDTTKSQIKPDTYIRRNSFGDKDFLLLTERQLITKCRENGIETQKANGEEYNNREKRRKLREYLESENTPSSYEWEKLPTSGTARSKRIHDEIKSLLPRFEYFRADTSLSEADASIQRYFKGIAADAMKEAGLDTIEDAVTNALGKVMTAISTKINRVLPDSDQINPSVTYDWSKVVQTGFQSTNEQAALPLNFRGDGFRRITMMSYFEYLAEEKLEDNTEAIFGFEEPETFLHPKAQEQLHEKLIALEESGYQVAVTTHSPIIVAASDRTSISHITNTGNQFEICQTLSDFQTLADDLGINPDNQFIKLFEKSKVLVLVEGPDDVKVFNFLSESYKQAGKISETFTEKQIVIVPVGGCDSVMHWINLNILRDLDKPYYAIQDSDRESAKAESPTKQNLLNLDLDEHSDFWVLRKRALENYLDKSALERLIPGLVIEYDDYTRMKPLCGQHASAVALGGKKVVDKHFNSQTFDELERSFKLPNGNDEFLEIYEKICSKL